MPKSRLQANCGSLYRHFSPERGSSFLNRACRSRHALYRARIYPCRKRHPKPLSSRRTPKELATEEEWRDPENASAAMLMQAISTNTLSPPTRGFLLRHQQPDIHMRQRPPPHNLHHPPYNLRFLIFRLFSVASLTKTIYTKKRD